MTANTSADLPLADHHTPAWPLLTLGVIYGPALAVGAWMAWRVVRKREKA